MEEQERIQHRQHIRLIVTEILMFVVVIFLVIFLTLVVMGYSFNLRGIGGQGEVVERTGLVQISSVPAGATITIDGGAPLLLRTNASRTVISGEHEITLSRDGFDIWSKTINVVEGLIYRLNYPRLFLLERDVEKVSSFDKKDVNVVGVSPNAERMVLVIDGDLGIMELNVAVPDIKMAKIEETSGEKVAKKVETVSEVAWSNNSERLLAKMNGEYFVINVQNLDEVDVSEVVRSYSEMKRESLVRSAEAKENGVEEVAIEIAGLKFESDAGDKLLLLTTSGELREINLREKNVSEAFLTDVIKFDNDGERIAYLASRSVIDEDNGEKKTLYELRAYRMGAVDSYLVRLVRNSDVKIAVMRYLQDFYFTALDELSLKIYKSGFWPEKDDAVQKIVDTKLSFLVEKLDRCGKGMVLAMSAGVKQAVFDIEAAQIKEFEMGEENGWVDEFLRYEIHEGGGLEVLDYDGLNRRSLVSAGVQSGKVITISGNGRWLYYFAEGELVREKIL